MEKALDFAKEYLEDLLSFFGLNVKVEGVVEENTIELNVPTTDVNGFLIGHAGENLRSIQYLTNMALKNAGFDEAIAVVDIAGYKRQKQDKLAEEIKKIAESVLKTEQEHVLEPMSAYERRVVHKTISDIVELESISTGEGRDRRVTIKLKAKKS
jgi:spoIIIJ-associated protein